MKPSNLSEPKFTTGPNRLVVGIPLIITADMPDGFMQTEIPKVWKTMYAVGGGHARHTEIPNVAGMPGFGVCDVSVDKDGNRQMLYIAALEVTSLGALPKGMISRNLEGGKFAVFTYRGVIDERVRKSMMYIHNEWLPESGRTMRATPVFEYYDERFMPMNSPESEFDICVPIE